MYDVIIVGGVPAGLSAALVLGRCLRKVLVCDSGNPRNASSQPLNAVNYPFAKTIGASNLKMLMLCNTKQLRFFRTAYDCAPDRSNVDGSVVIGVSNKAAVSASKLFTNTIANMVALRASFRGISRRYKNNLYAFCLGFILHKLPELVERPTVMQAFLRLAQALVGGLTDTRQILQGNRLIVGFCYDAVADRVINIFNRTLFLPTKPFQGLTRILSRGRFALVCLRLQRLSHLVSPQSVGIQIASAELSAIREAGNGTDAQIHPKHTARVRSGFTLFFNLDVQVIAEWFLNQLSRSRFLFCQCLALVVTNLQSELFPLVKQGKASNHQIGVERKDTTIKVRTGWLKAAVALLFLLKGNCHTGNGPDGKVSRKAKLTPNVGIASLVQGELFDLTVGTGIVSHKVASIHKSFQRSLEVLSLQLTVFQFAGYGTNDLHTCNLKKVSSLSKSIFSFNLSTVTRPGREPRFLRLAKAEAVSTAQSL